MTKGDLLARRAFHEHIDALHSAVESFKKAYLRAHEQYDVPLNLTYESMRMSFYRWLREGRLSAPLR